MAFCRKCGKEIADDAEFCRYCGESALLNSANNTTSDVQNTMPERGGAAVKSKKPLIAIIAFSVIVVCVIAVIIIIKLKSNPGKKIIDAFDNTLNAESFICTVENSKGEDAYLLEVMSASGKTDFYVEYSNFDHYLYADGKLYEVRTISSDLPGRPEVTYKFNEITGKRSLETVKLLSDRDIEGALKHSTTVKNGASSVCKNTEDILSVGKNMIVDYFKDPDKHTYIISFKQQEDTYRLTVDLVALFKSAKHEYGLGLSKKLLEFDGLDEYLCDIEITLDGKYIKKIAFDPEDSGYYYAASFKSINSVSDDNSKIKELTVKANEEAEKEYHEQHADTWTQLEYNGLAKTLFNSINTYIGDEDYDRGRDIKTVFADGDFEMSGSSDGMAINSSPTARGDKALLDSIKEYYPALLDDDSHTGRIFVEYNGDDKFVVRYEAPSGIVGQYPNNN